MAITVREIAKQSGNVDFQHPQTSREYRAWGSYVKTEIQIAVASTAPSADTSIDTEGNVIAVALKKIDLREIGGGAWEAICSYENTPDQFDLKFNIGTQTAKCLVAKEHIRVYDCKNGGQLDGPGDFTDGIPDFKKGINVAPGFDGEVHGVDIEYSKVEFTITKKASNATIAANYIQTLAYITPSVNVDVFEFTFKGQTFSFPRGSVLFRGATTVQSSDLQTEVSLMFAYSRGLTLTADAWDSGATYNSGDRVVYQQILWECNTDGTTDAPVPNLWTTDQTYAFGAKTRFDGNCYSSLANGNQGNEPDNSPSDWQDDGPSPWTEIGPEPNDFRVGDSDAIVKEGWQYMWFWFEQSVAAGVARPIPRAVVIDQVYDYGDFGLLDIPT